jgi:hypothetical protein
MKQIIFLAALVIIMSVCFIGCGSSSGVNSVGSEYSGYNIDELNSYGEWIDVEGYGRVWRPSVINSWQPYYNGHWTYSGADWVWVSYEPFGWIVYHYGNWDCIDTYGWVWIPGDNEWSPARVQWIEYGDYIGWSPLPYGGMRWPEPWEHSKVHPWNVVKREDFNTENIGARRVNNPPQEDTKQTIRPERRPPDVKVVERYVKAPIPVVKIEQEPVPMKREPIRIEKQPVKIDAQPVPTPGRVLHRLKVPDQENAKIERYRPTVEKEVLIPKRPKKEEPPTRQKKD